MNTILINTLIFLYLLPAITITILAWTSQNASNWRVKLEYLFIGLAWPISVGLMAAYSVYYEIKSFFKK